MNQDDMIADFKQFIAATVTQAVAPLADDLQQLKSDVTEIKQGLVDVNDRLDTIADALTTDIQDHDRRITRLEQQAA